MKTIIAVLVVVVILGGAIAYWYAPGEVVYQSNIPAEVVTLQSDLANLSAKNAQGKMSQKDAAVAKQRIEDRLHTITRLAGESQNTILSDQQHLALFTALGTLKDSLSTYGATLEAIEAAAGEADADASSTLNGADGELVTLLKDTISDVEDTTENKVHTFENLEEGTSTTGDGMNSAMTEVPSAGD